MADAALPAHGGGALLHRHRQGEEELSIEAYLTVALLAAVILTLALTNVSADVVMVGAVTLLLTAGILSPQDALAGMAEPGMLTVGALFVVAAAVRETGAMAYLGQRLLGRPKSVFGAQLRLMLPTAAMSAFMNNTPLVAMLLPVVVEWSKKIRVSPSKLMMPLSFATILGGLTTKIGTSTNVIVSGLMASKLGQPMGMFDLTWVALPAALAGIAFMLVSSRWLLPERKPPISAQDDPRAYTVEMLVEEQSPLVGQSIEEAGLRHLPSMYLVEIGRGDERLTAVGPETRLRGADRLVFVGVVESVVELKRIRGLVPAADALFKLDAPASERCLIEAVVSDSFPMLDQTIRDSRFRARYNAAIIAVARNGERIKKKIGDIVLKPGDTLLLEAPPTFVESQRNSRDFFLVSAVEDSRPLRHEKAWVALAILVGMVVALSLGVRSEVNVAMLAAGLMILTRCTSANLARRAVDWQVLLTIAASLGLGRALQSTGAAAFIAERFVGLVGQSPWLSLAAIYLVTMLFTELLSNNTAAVLMFPFAVATATSLGVSPLPFVFGATIAASCGFATPIGYQTNLMVYGPGGYRFTDYLRFGGGLNLLVFAVTVALAPLIWPF